MHRVYFRRTSIFADIVQEGKTSWKSISALLPLTHRRPLSVEHEDKESQYPSLFELICMATGESSHIPGGFLFDSLSPLLCLCPHTYWIFEPFLLDLAILAAYPRDMVIPLALFFLYFTG